jgi:hypothetical protein
MSPITAERQTCPRCRRQLPHHVAPDGCPLCLLDDDARHCTCREPVPRRLYLGSWLCVCSRLIVEESPFFLTGWGQDRCEGAPALNGKVFP